MLDSFVAATGLVGLVIVEVLLRLLELTHLSGLLGLVLVNLLLQEEVLNELGCAELIQL